MTTEALDQQTTLGRARLTFADTRDIDEFVRVLDQFERGEITPDQWRSFRLVRGTYGQRQTDDAQMLRVKIPQGLLDGSQLEALADVAERFSRGFGHITTRQNLQFHFMRLHDVEPAMRRLADAGLTTRESCGNSVRNITACAYAGVAADEVFDVTPYAEALTRYLLRHPLSSVLPRKFKIAFEGCREDHVATAINDIGFRARTQVVGGREVRGFLVTVAGGTSTMARSGRVLFEFLPASRILHVAESIVGVFHRLGDYKHKQRNRMKFLVKTIGWDRFREEIATELQGVASDGTPSLPFDPDNPPQEQPPPRAVTRGARTVPHAAGFSRWHATNVRRQKQYGYATVTVATLLGDLTASQLRLLAHLASSFGDGTVRMTSDQNLLLRWIGDDDVPVVHRRLVDAGLGRDGAGTLADVTSCPGAETCRLAVTQSRGLGRVLADHLDARRDVVDAVPGLNIKISGCPNGCGQHHIAGIGFQGSLRKVGGRPAPHYFVSIGGGTAEGTTTFGRLAATVPARRCAEAVDRLVSLYERDREPGESALAFFRRIDVAIARQALDGLDRLSPDEAAAEDFVDLGEEAAFNPEVQDGECTA
jgi:sulfite reductase beta subunit-like hemoprotein